MRIGAVRVKPEEVGEWITLFTNARATLNDTLTQCTTLKTSLTNLILFKDGPTSGDIEGKMTVKVDEFIKLYIQDKRFVSERGNCKDTIGQGSYYNTYMKIFDVLMDALRAEEVPNKLLHSLDVTVKSKQLESIDDHFSTAYMAENNITPDDVKYTLYGNEHYCNYYIAQSKVPTNGKIRWSVGLYYFMGKEQRRVGDINIMIAKIRLELKSLDSLLARLYKLNDDKQPKRFYHLRNRYLLLSVLEKRSAAVKEITETLHTGIIINLE